MYDPLELPIVPPAIEQTPSMMRLRALRRAFRAVDDQDWQYIVSVIPDGGRGRFWKAVLGEARAALSE